MTTTIHGVARSRAIRNLWMAYELGIPFEHDQVGFGPEGCRSARFLAINPNGHIPALSDDGLVIWESLAINLYLAKKAGGPLAPANLAEDGLATMWSVWVETEVEPLAYQLLAHTSSLPPEKRDPAKAKEATEALKAPLGVLEAALVKGGGTLIGGRFTVADVNLASVCFYLRMNPEVLADKPAIRAWYEAALARPAAKRAWALRGD
jgi:glutathione S-transferase